MASKEADSPSARSKKDLDLINRGVKRPNIPGTITFVGLRALDPFLQYGILTNDLGSSLMRKMGLQTLPHGLAANTGLVLIDKLGLSPYRLILLGMATGTTVKQIFWLLVTSQEEFPVSASLTVSAFNTFMNSMNSLLFTTVIGSASLDSDANFPQYPLMIGAALYVVGLTTETVAEIQRAAFKKDPANQGKPCTTGLWGLARHINYASYVVWRFGYALAGGGWIWASIVAAHQASDFYFRAIPVLDEYCSNRYGDMWSDFKKKTPYILVPGIL